MKKVLLAIIIFWLCGINVQAKEISHYMELARTFGIVRYFSPNPYVQDWSESDWIFPFSMTGMRMHCMNGDKHHGRGIIPDKTITVYAKDYIENFDRILHTALKY